MRKGELLVALAFAALSIYLMIKSAELPIGWRPGAGPGGGAFPFWLSAGMLLASIAVFIRGWRGATVHGRSSEPFVERETLQQVAIAAGAVFAMLALTHLLGAYVAIFMFFIFMLGVVGKRSWLQTIAVSVLTPIALFFFFEVGMKILLPKGITEPLFYPLYALFF